MRANRLADAKHRPGNHRIPINRISECLAHFEIIKRLLAIIDGENGFAFSIANNNRETLVGAELIKIFRRRIDRIGINIARHQRGVCG